MRKGSHRIWRISIIQQKKEWEWKEHVQQCHWRILIVVSEMFKSMAQHDRIRNKLFVWYWSKSAKEEETTVYQRLMNRKTTKTKGLYIPASGRTLNGKMHSRNHPFKVFAERKKGMTIIYLPSLSSGQRSFICEYKITVRRRIHCVIGIIVSVSPSVRPPDR